MSNIFEAVGDGDLARVEELLAQGGLDLAGFGPTEAKVTALYDAAECGYLDVANALIRAGAPLGAPGEDFSPLHGAVMGSHYDLAAMLLHEGAPVDAYSRPNINWSPYGGTPLSCAKDRRMAALLIAAGADVNASHSHRVPLRSAVAFGRLDVLQELISHPDINVNKQSGVFQFTPLHEAAYYRRHEYVAALLAAGADAFITDANEKTPLLYSFTPNYQEFRIVAMLVAAGDRQWDSIPSPCPGLESALLPVWTDAPDELGQLFSHLEDSVKRRIRAALCTLYHASPRHLPDHIRMRLLNEAFNV